MAKVVGGTVFVVFLQNLDSRIPAGRPATRDKDTASGSHEQPKPDPEQLAEEAKPEVVGDVGNECNSN